MENPVLILGAGPLAQSARDIFEGNGNVVYGFLDDDKKLHQTSIDDLSVLGSTDDDGFLKLIGKKCEAFIAVDEIRLKKGLVKMLQEVRKVQAVNAIHAKATLSPRFTLGHGNLIEASVVIGPQVVMGGYAIIQAGAVIGTGVRIGDFVNIGSGATVNSGVQIEDEAFIGSGAVLVAGVKIGKGARIGAGSVVIGDVKAGATVFGNPAKEVG